MRTRRTVNGSDGGSMLVAACVVTLVLGTIALALASASTRRHRAVAEVEGRLRPFYAAEAGLSEAWVELESGGDGSIANAFDPARLGVVDYWVEAAQIGNDVTSLLATASDGRRTARLELLVRTGGDEVEDFGVFGRERVTLRSGCLIDSYDSTLGPYASQVDGGHARDDGNVGSNGDVGFSANARVYGYAQCGPDDDDSIRLAPDVTVWDGFGAARTRVVLPPIPVPSLEGFESLTVDRRQDETLGPGDFQVASLITKSGSSLTLRGPCNLVITKEAILRSSSTWILDATSGPIRVYALNDFRLQRGASVRSTVEDPGRTTLYLCGVHDRPDDRSPAISFSADARFHGTVIAPELSLVIENTFELFGAVEARWLELASSARVHFDEKLAAGELDPGADTAILAWRSLEGALAPTR